MSEIVRELRSVIESPVLAPADPGYADALRGFNLAVEHRPDAVVVARSADDVGAAVSVAARNGVRVVPVGGGHGALTAITDGVAVVTSGLASVTVDADERTARIGAGTRWQEVLDAATPLGLAPLAGSSPLVGVVGYVLGGGLGPVARTFGYAADHVRSVELVDGTGALRTVDADSDPELFWAVRGGKTGFGVVTALTIDLFPVSAVYGGGLYFAAQDIPEVFHAWLDWGRGIPETVSTSVAILRLPPLPELPEPLRGQLVLHVRVAHVGDAEEGERLISPLRAVARPLMDTVGVLPYAELPRIHDDPANAMPYTEGGALIGHLDHEGVDRILWLAGPDADVPLISFELRQLGGALERQPQVPNAVPGRDAEFTVHLIGAPVPELIGTVLPEVIQGALGALAPWLADAGQPNFVGPANAAGDFAACWPADVAQRLDAVRAKADPQGIFASPEPA